MEFLMGTILEHTLLKDAMLSLWLSCYSPSLLCSIVMSLREFRVGYLDVSVDFYKKPLLFII